MFGSDAIPVWVLLICKCKPEKGAKIVSQKAAFVIDQIAGSVTIAREKEKERDHFLDIEDNNIKRRDGSTVQLCLVAFK